MPVGLSKAFVVVAAVFIVSGYTKKQHIVAQFIVQYVTTAMRTLWIKRKSNAHQISNAHSYQTHDTTLKITIKQHEKAVNR